MTQILDKRHSNRHKNAVNRRRFLERFKKQIRESVNSAVKQRSIKDFERGEKVKIPTKDTNEPALKHNSKGKHEMVLAGNKNFSRGDKIILPENEGGAGGGDPSNSTETGQDEFGFELSREEFLSVFFEDLELPNMLRKQLSQSKHQKSVRAGYVSDGIPSNLDVKKSLSSALGRKIAMRSAKKAKINNLKQELEETPEDEEQRRTELTEAIAKLENSIKKIPFIDSTDLRYHRTELQTMPATKAVVFCIMDVSGSMDEQKKEIAKKFFILLYLFLTKTYETIELIFIRHHTSAKEVNEQEFFYSRETGGTVVSSALQLTADIIYDRYPSSEWNIYVAQASDGDNWNNDSPVCRDILLQRIMPFVQYFAYVEIKSRQHQSLWEQYLNVAAHYDKFAMQRIENEKEIYQSFRELFSKHQEMVQQ